MISWMPMRRASACSLPFLSVASRRSIRRFAARSWSAVARVEVPVERAALGVEAGAVLAPLLAAHDSPGHAGRVLLEPVLQRDGAGLRVLLAAPSRGRTRSRRSAGSPAGWPGCHSAAPGPVPVPTKAASARVQRRRRMSRRIDGPATRAIEAIGRKTPPRVYTRVVTVERDGGVALVTLNRPEKRNALSLELRAQAHRGPERARARRRDPLRRPHRRRISASAPAWTRASSAATAPTRSASSS